jgi:DNA-binding NarL/FixJ family response regulator
MTIIIVDDDKLVCSSLKRIVEAGGIDVQAVGHSGEQAIAFYEQHHPDIILMDIRMGGMTGLDAGKIILEQDKRARILFLTTFNDDEYIVKALGMGAKGYILKQNFESIVPALTAVSMGQSIFGDEIVSRIPQMLSKEKKERGEFDLSEREYEIVELVSQGLNNKEIAIKLYLSEGTVRNYISIVLEKLVLRDRTQLAIFYYQNFHS